MFTKVQQFMDSFLEMGIPGFDCIIYKDGREAFRYMNGYRNLEQKLPMRGDERYNIYSCSKPITCTAALQLFEKGKFSLEDPLSKYIPAFAEMTVQTEEGIVPANKPITILDLFCMGAGFTYNTNSANLRLAREETGGRCPTVKTMDYLAKDPLQFHPGEKYAYSLCHDVLAAVVEVISGMPFAEYVKKNIFDPLGMIRSTFMLPEEELDSITEQYRYNNELKRVINCGKKIQTYKLGSEYASGGAGCISTAEDYILFLEAMRKGDILLKRETIDMMSINHLTQQQLTTYGVSGGYGYGLGVRCTCGNDDITEFGWGGAAGAYLSIDRTNQMTVFYVQHVLNSPNQGIRQNVRPLALEILR